MQKSSWSFSSKQSSCNLYVKFTDWTKRAFARVIPNKQASTLIPIICSQVASNSTIWTDAHLSYSSLASHNFIHGTVCHKYNFINHLTSVNTQAVESFNNLLKRKIKERMGVRTDLRSTFLNEICWIFNHSNNLFNDIIAIITTI